MVTFICDNCGKEAQKPLSEYNRNIKLGRKNFVVELVLLHIDVTYIKILPQKHNYKHNKILRIIVKIIKMSGRLLDILSETLESVLKNSILLLKISNKFGNNKMVFVRIQV